MTKPYFKKVSLFFIGLSLLLALFICYRLFCPLNKKGREVLLDISSGQTFYQLAEELEKKNLIRSGRDMKFLIRLFNLPSLPKGEYRLSPRQSLWQIFQTVKQGRERTFFVRFPEGMNHYEMAQVLKSHNWPAVERFIEKVSSQKLVKKLLRENFNSLEGYLFPDSYSLRKYMTAEALIEMMLKKFLTVYQPLAARNLQGLTPHQAVTLASLIEKETGRAEERALISGVFYNRLQKKMKLQTDPSVLYAMYLLRGFDIEKNIRKKDLSLNSPYNTYVIYGLPPGPIANPGELSLQAVFSPEPSDYLYFVSRNDSSHKFSKTYKEHKKAVYEYQIKAFKK